MHFINDTPFPALDFDAEDQSGTRFNVVVARTTWTISPQGTLVVAPEQPPLLDEDEDWPRPDMGPYNGEEACIRQESDLAPYKPRTDILVLGEAHAPKGNPSKRWPVRIQVQAPVRAGAASGASAVILDQMVIVTGPRWWEKRLGGYRLSEPEEAVTVPLTYAYAYGGEIALDELDNVDPGVRRPVEVNALRRSVDAKREARVICEANPAGRGVLPRDAPEGIRRVFDALKRIPAPQIESPDDPIRDWEKDYAPVGVGVMGRTWTQRYRHVGNFEVKERYAEDEFPALPRDFGFAYWNSAHPDMQVPHLVGDETIGLLNCCPPDAPGVTPLAEGQLLSIRLPGDALYLRVQDAFGRIGVKRMVLDTVIVEPVARRVTLIWRCATPALALLRLAALRWDSAQSRADAESLSELAMLRVGMRLAQARADAYHAAGRKGT